jgi:hypothetical protein
MGHDIEGILEIDQGVEAVAGGVLDLELMADALAELARRPALRPQGGEALKQMTMTVRELGPALVVGGIDHGAVGQHQAHAVQGLVAVLLHPAAHAAGVVGEDATDLGAVDGGRIGPDLAVELGQEGIGAAADDARCRRMRRAWS